MHATTALRQRVPTPPAWPAATGFTLVELLVALAVLALMASMTWLGLDALLRSRSQTQAQGHSQAQMHVALSQWTMDLNEAFLPSGSQPMNWDGQVFRLTRRLPPAQGAAAVVVAWAVRSDGQAQRWMRWQSPPLTRMDEWQSAWQAAALWGRGGALGEPALLPPAQGMEIFFWVGNAWVNGQSSSGAIPPELSSALGRALSQRLLRRSLAQQPQGVRLELHTPQGVLTKDWAGPAAGATL